MAISFATRRLLAASAAAKPKVSEGGNVPSNALRSRVDDKVLVTRINEQPLISRFA